MKFCVIALFHKHANSIKSSKAAFTIAFFAAVNHDYDKTKRIQIHQSQITNHDLLNPLK